MDRIVGYERLAWFSTDIPFSQQNSQHASAYLSSDTTEGYTEIHQLHIDNNNNLSNICLYCC